MTWQYALIGLVAGIVIGALAMRFGNRKLREQHHMRYELEKTQAELADYREELSSHFSHSTELLSNMARDYHQLHQHIEKGSNSLLTNFPGEKKPFAWQLTESEADNDHVPVQIPRDYSDTGASGLLRDERSGRD